MAWYPPGAGFPPPPPGAAGGGGLDGDDLIRQLIIAMGGAAKVAKPAVPAFKLLSAYIHSILTQV